MIGPMIRAAILAAGLTFSLACHADYRATGDPATILYDAPSARAKPLFVYGRDVPVEVLVSVEGWTKVRDASGTIGWIASRSLSDKRMIEVRAPGADIRAAADDSSPVVFRADADVLLEVAEPATITGDGGCSRLGQGAASRWANRLCAPGAGIRLLSGTQRRWDAERSHECDRRRAGRRRVGKRAGRAPSQRAATPVRGYSCTCARPNARA